MKQQTKRISDSGAVDEALYQKAVEDGFEELGVRPWVYHVRDYESGGHRRRLRMFNGITIASEVRLDTAALSRTIGDLDRECEIGALFTYPPNRIDTPATWMRNELAVHGFNGAAICDRRDQFRRRSGWLKACGRLLKYLRRCDRS